MQIIIIIVILCKPQLSIHPNMQLCKNILLRMQSSELAIYIKCDCLSENPPRFALVSISRNIVLKIQLKNASLALLLDSFTILSYLLALVQLTWQVDNG